MCTSKTSGASHSTHISHSRIFKRKAATRGTESAVSSSTKASQPQYFSRATHGRLRGAVRAGREWLSGYPLAVGLSLQALISIEVPQSWCLGLWLVLCVCQSAAVVLVLVYRPARTPLVNALQSCGWLIAALIQLLAGLAANGVGVATALSILSLLKMCASVVKSVHSVLILIWERRQQRRNDDVKLTAHITPLDASSSRNTNPTKESLSFEQISVLKELLAVACARDDSRSLL
jgi:hypothetical protein